VFIRQPGARASVSQRARRVRRMQEPNGGLCRTDASSWPISDCGWSVWDRSSLHDAEGDIHLGDLARHWIGH
jgi:hypothetical protein